MLEGLDQTISICVFFFFFIISDCFALDDPSAEVSLEQLEVHDLRFDGVNGDHPVDCDDPLLPDTMCTVDGLDVLERVPVMLHEDHSVGTREVQTKGPHLRRQQKDPDG